MTDKKLTKTQTEMLAWVQLHNDGGYFPTSGNHSDRGRKALAGLLEMGLLVHVPGRHDTDGYVIARHPVMVPRALELIKLEQFNVKRDIRELEEKALALELAWNRLQ